MKILAFTVLFFLMFAVIATAKPTPQIIYSTEMRKKIDAHFAQAKEAEKRADETPMLIRRVLFVIFAFVCFLVAFIFKVSLASFIYRVISGNYADARRRKRTARQLEAKRRKSQQSMA